MRQQRRQKVVYKFYVRLRVFGLKNEERGINCNIGEGMVNIY
jgi:hypothetical protein